ncbi:hypothetical protein V496_06947 [Pseudogymnoascus sp. VKM F-4515 (FW-2607)]|nr:hypothetical protein V496_06947 [Pseudogymnoascus sp. VKM F-4515 (FW-2607)]
MTTTNVNPHQAALSPKTTRRQMVATELTASLRRHLLWERKQKNQIWVDERYDGRWNRNLTPTQQQDVLSDLSNFPSVFDSLSNYEDNLRDAASYEPFYASSSPSEFALNPCHQSLSHAPEFNESLPFANDQHDDDINFEDTAGYRGHYGAIFDSESYRDKVYDAATYGADILEESVKLIADIPRDQQHVEANSDHCASYNGGLDGLTSNFEDKNRDAASYQANITDEEQDDQANRIYKSILSFKNIPHPPAPWFDDFLLPRIREKYGIPTHIRGLSDRHNEGDLRGRGNPYASSLNAKPRENRRKVLPVQIKDKDHLACPDSGSEKNIISKACAVEHGFRIRHRKTKDIKRFEVGNGDIVWSIGRVFETVGLPGSPLWKKKRWFYVLDNCPVPLVMGMEFLREAEVLTKYRHLLENCPVEMSNISSLLWIGSPRNRLRCTFDGRQLEAVADTGSDLNLMSLACAEREGFRIDRRTEVRTEIVVGNGEVIETLGQVYVSNLTLDWREPEAEPPEQPPRRRANDVPLEPDPHGSTQRPHGGDDDLYIAFHVVENLPCDIILGQKFLIDTDAFNKCPELLNIPPSDQNRQFEKHKLLFDFMIFRSNILPHISFFKKPKLPIDLREQHESNWHAERYRRLKNTERIALLPPGEQEAARKTETKKVRDWNTAHVGCKFCNTGSTT